ncbi:histone acetyltransferase MYST2 [Nematocida homosporus]|uniref:histone acetyltransferase MYST2 n=1 Tax=Nematocida homosporus TaxID=1912981 RepID=UPI00221F2006|nr:histone acetyltransferase MYST2 [Nematocida homosporus]KAI5187348.1 histone acetyltransferase MYST2 [Nematocida homosporus]
MKCSRCLRPFAVEDHIEKKALLIGKDSLMIYCDDCSICYLCFRDKKEYLVRCKRCGYHYHHPKCTTGSRLSTTQSNYNPPVKLINNLTNINHLSNGVISDSNIDSSSNIDSNLSNGNVNSNNDSLSNVDSSSNLSNNDDNSDSDSSSSSSSDNLSNGDSQNQNQNQNYCDKDKKNMSDDSTVLGGEDWCCKKCLGLSWEMTYRDLVGPEVPVLERVLENVNEDLGLKVREICKRVKGPGRSEGGIKKVYLEEVEMKPLFASPYPEEYVRYGNLYICGQCLDCFSSEYTRARHKLKCFNVYPPGQLLYLDTDGVCIFEVEGSLQKSYCQSLCLLAKMFLNHKTLYYDVEPFLFYVQGEIKGDKFEIQGYFSKEKESGSNNLSCIVVFPPYRKTGLGSFLIDFSYLLTKRREKPPYIAGPEQPLSEEGERAYLTYWCDVLVRYVLSQKYALQGERCLQLISNGTGVSVRSLKKAYQELTKIYKKPPGFADLLANRYAVKRTRRINRQGLRLGAILSSSSSIKDSSDKISDINDGDKIGDIGSDTPGVSEGDISEDNKQ